MTVDLYFDRGHSSEYRMCWSATPLRTPSDLHFIIKYYTLQIICNHHNHTHLHIHHEINNRVTVYMFSRFSLSFLNIFNYGRWWAKVYYTADIMTVSAHTKSHGWKPTPFRLSLLLRLSYPYQLSETDVNLDIYRVL